MKILSKIKLPLIFFLIGFAHIFVSLAAFAISMFATNGMLFFTMPLIFLLCVFAGMVHLLRFIANKHDSHKWLWMVIVGLLFGFVWMMVEARIDFGINIYIYELLVDWTDEITFGMTWGLVWLPATFVLTIAESCIAHSLIKRKQQK